jgi:PadR family transcriptional regulator, regulatory protein PadR
VSSLERITQPTLDVLEALLAAERLELHGWAIMKTTGRAGPTVYKVLERLAEAGWVTRSWEEQPPDANRPRRRLYRLTPDGSSRAQELLVQRRRVRFGRQPRVLGAGGAA